MNATGDPHPRAAQPGPISPHDLFYLDKKFDDGVPNAGIIIADDVSSTCWNATTFQYIENSDALTCIAAHKF